MSIAEIAWLLGYAGGSIPLYLDGKPNPAKLIDFDGEHGRAAMRLEAAAQRLDQRRLCELAIGLPERDGFIPHATALWVWIRGSEQFRRARDFVRRPSIALQMGGSSQRLLLWALRQPLPEPMVEAHNDRLAYALHAPRTRTKPGALRVPLPGTFLRIDRTRPVPITLTRCEETAFTLDELTGRLKDPPPRDAWKRR